ncbi:MAG: hypothetical protein CME63_17530 [Halobacteriovoraceae bacterium]|nr:hypothetical protein [Halobacteriovoraceae bacterium]MBC99550.1 hypothetical protein [Halobacteriovoraceae bacterium]
MKKILPALLLGLSFNTFSPLHAQDLELLDGDFVIGYEGEVNTNLGSGTESGTLSNLDNSYISLNAEWKNKIRLVLTGKLQEIFKENSVEFNDDFSIEEFVKEAYIEIKEVGGSPIAVIVGKQPIPFAQNVQAMPIFSNNPLADLQKIDEVYGLTVDLTEGLFGIFDQVEVSAFETVEGDMSIGSINGVSVRLSKMLTDNILLTMGHAELGNDHLTSGNERRTTVGLIGESNDGMLVGWVEGMYFSNNPKYPDSSFAITVGGMMRVHRTTDVIVEFNYVEKEVLQYAIGTRTALTESLSLGVEARYNDHLNGKDDIVLGINLTYQFGSSPIKPNEEYLFDDED